MEPGSISINILNCIVYLARKETDHMERKVPKYEKHKIRERKERTLTKHWRVHGGQAHKHTHGNKIEIFQRTRPSFSIRREWMYVSTRQGWHSFDWEGWPCPSKYFNFVSVCVFVCLSTVISSIFGKSSHFHFPYFLK